MFCFFPTDHKTAFHDRQLSQRSVDSSCRDASGHFPLIIFVIYLSTLSVRFLLGVPGQSYPTRGEQAWCLWDLKWRMGWTLIPSCSLELASKCSCQHYKRFLSLCYNTKVNRDKRRSAAPIVWQRSLKARDIGCLRAGLGRKLLYVASSRSLKIWEDTFFVDLTHLMFHCKRATVSQQQQQFINSESQ